MIPEYCNSNIEELARAVVDSWEMDTLINYAVDQLEAFYKKDKEQFLEDWSNTF